MEYFISFIRRKRMCKTVFPHSDYIIQSSSIILTDHLWHVLRLILPQITVVDNVIAVNGGSQDQRGR